ncbi:YcdB/YcdC domain-containing protein [Brevibacillus daliensis]|uniref:YcdB/YcdC domain-containing protein n=1 Tax=Brevibacillus daliensis TaxID=2892995 RepID=UPI001E5A6859|nr:YcdB/YcdC domain-containing protein [Brevibacillus daliensis]
MYAEGRMKKKVAGSCSILLAMSFLTPVLPIGNDVVYASEAKVYQRSITQSEAEKIVRNLVTIPKEYKLHTIKEVMQAGKNKTWELVWNAGTKDIKEISATLNGVNGELLSYSLYDETPKNLDKIVDTKQAEVIATNFLSKASLTKRNQLSKPNEFIGAHSTSGGYHSFIFHGMVEGIPVMENYIRIDVGKDGEIKYYLTKWSDMEINPVTPAFTEAQAANKLKSMLEPTLFYKENSTQGLVPLYKYTDQSVRFMDARTGEGLSVNGEVITTKPKHVRLGTTTSFVNAPRKVITSEEASVLAETYAKKLAKFYSYGGSGGGGSITEGGKTYVQWDYIFTAPDQDKSKQVTISISDRGELESFKVGSKKSAASQKQNNQINQKPISLDTAKDRAIQFMKQLYPQHEGQIYYTEEWDSKKLLKNNEYTFKFGVLHHGVPLDGDRFRVVVNALSGEVTNFNQYDHMGLHFIKDEGNQPPKLTREEAVKLDLKNKKLALQYVFFNETVAEDGTEMEKLVPRLVYEFIDDSSISADGKKAGSTAVTTRISTAK